MKQQRVGIFSRDYLDFGGVETQILSIIDAYAEQELSFYVLASVSEKFKKKLEASGAIVVSWSAFSVFDLQAYLKLISLIQEYELSLLHIHGYGGSLVGRIAAAICKIPAVVTVHLSLFDYYGQGNFVARAIKVFLMLIADILLNYCCTEKIIYVSRAAYQKAIAKKWVPAKKAEFILNEVRLANPPQNRPRPLRSDLNILESEFLLLFVGRLDYQKGLDVLLKSLGTVEDEFHLALVGDGPEREKLIALANDLGIEQRVHFLGYWDDISGVLASGDVFVLPSRYEATPYALLEALCMGLPCLVTDVGESAYLVGDAGLVVPVENVGLLAQAIRLFAENDYRSGLAENAQIRCEEFSKGEGIGKLLDIYYAALG